MGRSMSKKQKELHYHSWEDNHERGVYIMRNYKMSYITITRWMPGEIDPITKETYTEIQYIPTTNGTRLNNRFTHVSQDIQWRFNTLEEAKMGAMKNIDFNRELSLMTKIVIVKDK